jgi:transposase
MDRRNGRRSRPNATLCLDGFHIVAWATDALDIARRQDLPTTPADRVEFAVGVKDRNTAANRGGGTNTVAPC